MPIYEYRCPSCKQEREVILPVRDMDTIQECSCGEVMTRLISLPHPAIFVVTNKAKLVNTLNDDEKAYRLPGNQKHGKRYKEVIGRSLTLERPVIGRGF